MASELYWFSIIAQPFVGTAALFATKMGLFPSVQGDKRFLSFKELNNEQVPGR
jgi:hypothetical protein